MNENYILFFEDIDHSTGRRFGKIKFDFQLVGYVALAFAGLPPGRETKDIDTLKTETLSSPGNTHLIKFLNAEFGKKSPGLYKHGMYLDFVPMSIVWLPPKPQFIHIRTFNNMRIFRLDPTDVCVSKIFSYSKSRTIRSNDRSDIINALDHQIIDFENLLQRIDETLPIYEAHAEAPDTFSKLLRLINRELIPDYGPDLSLKYEIPNWMGNM